MNKLSPMTKGTWAVLAFVSLVAGPLEVADSAEVKVPWLRDMQLTVHARRALMDDPVLTRLNLGVNVRDGIATVWGPIPNEELGRRAKSRVESIQGVLKVRSDFYPQGPKKEDELPDLPFVFEMPTRSESASPNRDSGEIANLTARPKINFPAEIAKEGPPANVSLLAPVALPGGAPPIAQTPPVARPPALPLASAIELLRKNDDRFRPIAAELKNGVVLLRGGPANGEHVMAFAQAISRLPGVERVVVLNNE